MEQKRLSDRLPVLNGYRTAMSSVFGNDYKNNSVLWTELSFIARNNVKIFEVKHFEV